MGVSAGSAIGEVFDRFFLGMYFHFSFFCGHTSAHNW